MYKIIQNGLVIDVVKFPNFICFLPTGHVTITNKALADGITGSDNETIYVFNNTHSKKYDVVSIEEISSEEFNRLKSLLNSNETVSADESALALAKQEMIHRASGICKNKIHSGFSIELSDDVIYNFKLTNEDQLNLLMLENQLNTGTTSFIYHATDLPCKIFNKEDMQKIITTAKRHILYHTTYFNTVKLYLNSLVDIEKVNLFTYGMDVSAILDDPVLKQILKNGGNFE